MVRQYGSANNQGLHTIRARRASQVDRTALARIVRIQDSKFYFIWNRDTRGSVILDRWSSRRPAGDPVALRSARCLSALLGRWTADKF